MLLRYVTFQVQFYSLRFAFPLRYVSATNTCAQVLFKHTERK
jgi:hypothetical protein